MRFIQFVIAGTKLPVFIFVLFLSGCHGVLLSHEAEVRDLPDDVKGSIAIGDTRETVRSTLGAPLIDAQNLGLEVYKKSGRDLHVGWVFLPIFPGPFNIDKTVAVVLVVYDKQGLVKDVNTRMVKEEHHLYSSFWLAASDFVFTNAGSMSPPDLLLGPAVDWEDFQMQPIIDGRCDLIFLMRLNCQMEKVSLDNEVIAKLSPGAGECLSQLNGRYSYSAALIIKDIPSGFHQIDIHQKTWSGDFNTSFECEPNETVYAEFQAQIVKDWWSYHFEGAITINKNAPSSAFRGRLRQILWHGDTWYGPPNSLVPASQ